MHYLAFISCELVFIQPQVCYFLRPEREYLLSLSPNIHSRMIRFIHTKNLHYFQVKNIFIIVNIFPSFPKFK